MKTAGFTLVLTLVIFSTALAQTEKGTWLVGAQVGNFSYRQFRKNSGFEFSGSLTPSVNYFVAKNWLIGLEIPFSAEKYVDRNRLQPYGNAILQLGVGPTVKYYFGHSNFKPVVGINYTYSRYASKYNPDASGKYTTTSSGFRGNLAPSAGVAWFINRSVVLNAELSYNFYQDKWKNRLAGGNNLDNSSHNYKTRSLALEIGFAILFGGKSI